MQRCQKHMDLEVAVDLSVVEADSPRHHRKLFGYVMLYFSYFHKLCEI